MSPLRKINQHSSITLSVFGIWAFLYYCLWNWLRKKELYLDLLQVCYSENVVYLCNKIVFQEVDADLKLCGNLSDPYSYFGHDFVVKDFNGNGLNDIIVGAPTSGLLTLHTTALFTSFLPKRRHVERLSFQVTLLTSPFHLLSQIRRVHRCLVGLWHHQGIRQNLFGYFLAFTNAETFLGLFWQNRRKTHIILWNYKKWSLFVLFHFWMFALFETALNCEYFLGFKAFLNNITFISQKRVLNLGFYWRFYYFQGR